MERSRRALNRVAGLWDPSPNVGSRRPDATPSQRRPRLLDTGRVALPIPPENNMLNMPHECLVQLPYFRGEPENKRVSTDEFARRLSEHAALRRGQEERAITRAPALSQHRLPVTKWQESSIFGMWRAGNRSPAERKSQKSAKGRAECG